MIGKVCKVEGCSNSAIAKELCQKHYRRNRIYGSPLLTNEDINPRQVTCSIDGCGLPHQSQGYCDKHYQQWRKGLGRFSPKHSRARPFKFVELESGCYISLSHSLNQDGYLRIYLGLPGMKYKFMHRIVWESWHGLVPDGCEVNHVCGNRACCNIDHLEVLPRKEHLIKTNKERILSRNIDPSIHWEAEDGTD